MRRPALIATVLVIAAFVGLVIASSIGGTGGTHSMPDGQTMQDADMAR